jgi:putative RNA 2'-phosphotransferase
MSKSQVKQGQFLSYVLRHKPEDVGIQLDASGWVDIDVLLAALKKTKYSLSREELQVLVDTNAKKRYEISDDGKRIRASQGHSVEVELGYTDAPPPELLYHGTVEKFIDGIRAGGLKKGSRHDVHLSPGTSEATIVGKRRGEPVILTIRSGDMHRDGFKFQVSTNGVWLTGHVPPQYIEFPSGQ